MLYDTGADAFEDLFMLLEILVEILDADFVGAHHLLVDVRQAEATLLERHHVAKGLKHLGVDEHLLKVLGRRVVGIEGVAVDDEETDGLVDLRGGQSYAFGVRQCLPHVIDKGTQFRIIGCDGLGESL